MTEKIAGLVRSSTLNSVVDNVEDIAARDGGYCPALPSIAELSLDLLCNDLPSPLPGKNSLDVEIRHDLEGVSPLTELSESLKPPPRPLGLSPP